MRYLAALLLVTGAGACHWAAGTLASPAPREVGELPGDLPGHSVRLLSPAAGTPRGWVVPGRRGAGVVLLLHGIGGSRLDMIERARFLHAAGYTVLLLFDMRAPSLPFGAARWRATWTSSGRSTGSTAGRRPSARSVPQPQTRARVGFPSPRPRGNICSRLAAWPESRFDRR